MTPSARDFGFRWIDLVGTVLLPLGLIFVGVHAIVRKVRKPMKRIYLHSLPLRIWHWANALVVIILLVTGFQIRVPGIASLRPQDPALLIHKYVGWAMVVSWVFWVIYSLASGNLRRHYFFRKRDFGGIFKQTKFYLFSIFKGEENPFRPTPEEKFNPLQKLAYGAIM